MMIALYSNLSIHCIANLLLASRNSLVERWEQVIEHQSHLLDSEPCLSFNSRPHLEIFFDSANLRCP